MLTRTDKLQPIHPGEILKEEFMVPLRLNVTQLARGLKVAPNRISQIINGRRSITAGTAIRLSVFFGTTPQFWLNLQSLYDLDVSRVTEEPEIRKQVHPISETIWSE